MKYTWVAKTAMWDKAILSIEKVPWPAGAHLAEQMKNHALTDWENVLVCWQKEELVGFCALLKKDILKQTALTPFIGVVFVAEKYRGHRISQKLVAKAEEKARSLGFEHTFIATQHLGLYEKFGYHKIGEEKDIFDRWLNLYQKDLTH